MERKLQITGKGKLSISPDIIILSFNAQAHEWEYEKTISSLNKKVEELRLIIESERVDRTSLKTKDFNVRKETTWNKKTEKYDFNGFKASHNLELEITLNKALINTLLGKIAKDIDNLDFGISFGVKDASKHQQLLIINAIEKAKENAAVICNTTAVELKEILDIDYSFREISIRSEQYNYPVYESDRLMSTAEATPDFEPDDIDVTESITITWRIE